MPAPGSLAKKIALNSHGSKPEKNETAHHSDHALRRATNQQTTSANQATQVSAAKSRQTSGDGAHSTDTDNSETDESASTDQDSASDSDSVSAVVPQLRQVTLVHPSKNPKVTPATTTIAISRKKFPAGHKYRATGVSEAELKRVMYWAVDQSLSNKKVPKNPSSSLPAWLKRTSEYCGLRPAYLNDVQLPDDCEVKKPLDLLKRVLKKYYDDRGISQKNRAADCPWLRG